MKTRTPASSLRIVILSVVLLCASLLLIPANAPAQQYTIKFATLAFEGSTWMNVMKEFDQAIRKESGGRMGFKIYPGGVQGDEKDVLRKIKLGQIHSAGVTGNGLTSIAPGVRLLDSPFLFRSYDEADHIIAEFGKEFNAAFEQNGFINLGWTEVGFVNVFTNKPVKVPADMKGIKMWMWEGDPVAEATFKALDVSPIPLSISDVLTSLQTKLIDGVYGPPIAVIGLQWFTRVKYMLNIPLADAQGAVVISKKKFDELPADLQEILRRNGMTFMRKLTEITRKENGIETLKKSGITIVEAPSPDVAASYEAIGKRARRLLAGKLFDQQLIDRVEASLDTFRKSGAKKSK
jgi:TRAP-type transport system periplasmic protein